MDYHSSEQNFLGIEDENLHSFEKSKIVIQSAPYEHTSSYIEGSVYGPNSIIMASQFVEFYDEETDQEAYLSHGICTIPAIEFGNCINKEAIDLIYNQTKELLAQDKYVISLGAEHTVTFGFVKAFKEKFDNLSVLQIDAHSDLRLSYHDNPYSHASVMARINELDLPICQIGIRAQCKEESELIKSTPSINTWYAHQLWDNEQWMDECIEKLTDNVYLTIDADGFDPSVCPAVGTAEPGGLLWYQGLKFLRKVCEKKKIVGFDIVECAPRVNEIITEFNLAKLVYKIISYQTKNNKI